MPALVKSKLGELGSKLAEGTIVCRFSRKKSKKDCLISEAFIMRCASSSREDARKTDLPQVRALNPERSRCPARPAQMDCNLSLLHGPTRARPCRNPLPCEFHDDRPQRVSGRRCSPRRGFPRTNRIHPTQSKHSERQYRIRMFRSAQSGFAQERRGETRSAGNSSE